MTEEKKPEKKAWVVSAYHTLGTLEDRLNELATDGYQAFRIEPTGDGGWIVIAFDPSQIAERQGRALAETMGKLAGLPMFTPPGNPTP